MVFKHCRTKPGPDPFIVLQ